MTLSNAGPVGPFNFNKLDHLEPLDFFSGPAGPFILLELEDYSRLTIRYSLLTVDLQEVA